MWQIKIEPLLLPLIRLEFNRVSMQPNYVLEHKTAVVVKHAVKC
jgi:hypothetical protein